MINFNELLENKEKYRLDYLTAKPFPHLVLKDICDEKKLMEVYETIPVLDNKSRDYMFAKNKFEKSNYGEISPLLKELQEDLRSDEMNEFLSYITVQEVFVDPKNHGGGLHQGRKSSFLDMHLDYNYHPINNNWWREVNLLLYMNKNWKQEYGGQLDLKDLRTGEEKSCDVDFNTLRETILSLKSKYNTTPFLKPFYTIDLEFDVKEDVIIKINVTTYKYDYNNYLDDLLKFRPKPRQVV